MTRVATAAMVRGLWVVLGRRNLARFARFLTNEVRLDVENDPRSNGELLVQQRVIEHHTGEAGMCVLDVGANVGKWSRSFCQAAERRALPLTIHAFEPAEDTFATLASNLDAWSLAAVVRPHRIALSSAQGERIFYSLGPNIGVNSLYEHRDPEVASLPRRQYQVATSTVDAFCAEHRIERIHMLKIDTEGHDMDVLRGCREMLERRAIDVIQFEYNHRWINARSYLRDVFDLVAPIDLSLGKVTPRGIEWYPAWHHELETFREGNYLLASSRLGSAFPAVTWWWLAAR